MPILEPARGPKCIPPDRETRSELSASPLADEQIPATTGKPPVIGRATRPKSVTSIPPDSRRGFSRAIGSLQARNRECVGGTTEVDQGS
jgi:hypothetical protein